MRLPDDIIISTMQGVIDLYLIPRFKELGMNATGNWINALEPRVENGNGAIYGLDYTYWLQNGRGKNDDQSEEGINHFTKWAGYYIFKPWAESKGLSVNPYAVARKIAKEGTKVRPERQDFLEILSSKEVLDYVYGRFGEAFRFEINKILIKQLNDNFA